MEISGGLIQHNTICSDEATFARQIGMLPAQGSPADRALMALFNAKTRLSQRYQDALRRRQARHANAAKTRRFPSGPGQVLDRRQPKSWCRSRGTQSIQLCVQSICLQTTFGRALRTAGTRAVIWSVYSAFAVPTSWASTARRRAVPA